MTTETESVADVLAEFLTTSDNCGELQSGTIDRYIQRIADAHAREVGDLNARAEAVEAKLSETLPCDVAVWPGTIINEGCKVSTLLACIDLRRDGVAEVDAQAVADFALLLRNMRAAPHDTAMGEPVREVIR